MGLQFSPSIRRVWRYQRGNQNPYSEKEQTTQWPKEKVQKDKPRSTKHTYKTKDRVWIYHHSTEFLTYTSVLSNSVILLSLPNAARNLFPNY